MVEVLYVVILLHLIIQLIHLRIQATHLDGLIWLKILAGHLEGIGLCPLSLVEGWGCIQVDIDLLALSLIESHIY